MTTPSAQLIVCRTGQDELDTAVRDALAAALPGTDDSWVGPRPGKAIDPLLSSAESSHTVVVGDDGDLAAVVLRLLRTDRLGTVRLGLVPLTAGPVATRFGTGVGAAALRGALHGTARDVVLVRDDVGGVLLAEGRISPVGGPVYVDSDRLADVPTPDLVVRPADPAGVTVTATRRRRLGLGRAGTTLTGRATQIAGPGMQIVRDGVTFPRVMDRWTWYRHTEPLRLITR